MKQCPVTGSIHKNEPESIECSASVVDRFFGKDLMTLKEYNEVNKRCSNCDGSGKIYSNPKGKAFSDERQTCSCVPRESSSLSK